LPINGEPNYSFTLKDLHLVKLDNWPPNEFKSLDWNEAKEEINRHWGLLSKATIFSPYPIQGYCLGSAQAPMLVNALSEGDSLISSILQENLDDYFKIKIRYFLFPLKNSKFQEQAVAQVVCDTMPDAERGGVSVWVDALRENELQEINILDINYALSKS